MRKLLAALMTLGLAATPVLTVAVVQVASSPAATAASTTAAPAALGDLTSFETIAVGTLDLVRANDMAGAAKRITDFETAWDAAQPILYPRNHDQWSVLDEAADAAIFSLRSKPASQQQAETAVGALVAALQDPANH